MAHPFGGGFFYAIVDPDAGTDQNTQRISTLLLKGKQMSAHNVLENQLVADHTLIPPSSGATIDVDRSPALVQVAVTACKLPVPQVAGLRLAIYNNAGSACSVTMLGGGNFQNNDGGTGTTLSVDDEELVEVISVDNAGTLQWKELAETTSVS